MKPGSAASEREITAQTLESSHSRLIEDVRQPTTSVLSVRKKTSFIKITFPSISGDRLKKIYINENMGFRKEKVAQEFGPFLGLCVSSLRRDHAILLYIVPISSDVSEETVEGVEFQQ